VVENKTVHLTRTEKLYENDKNHEPPWR